VYLWSFDDFKPGEGGLNDREAGDLQDSGQMRHESVASYGPRATSGASALSKINLLAIFVRSGPTPRTAFP